MRKSVSLFAFLAISFFTGAQSPEIERWRQLIKEHVQQDTFRVNRLTDICNTSPRIPIGEMEKYAAEALTLSRKLNYKMGEGYALIVNARANYGKGNTEAADNLLRQADTIAKKTGDLLMQYWVFLRFSGCYASSDIRLSLSWALKCEEVAMQLDNKRLLANILSPITQSYIALGDYGMAMEKGLKSLKNAEELKMPLHLYSAWDDMGYIYTLIGEYQKSSIYYQKLPGLFKELGFGNDQQAGILNSLGENYRLDKKYPEAIRYYKQALAVASLESSKAVYESNLADIYVNLDSLSTAFYYAFKSLAVVKKLELHQFEPWLTSILARAYLKKNMPDSALYYSTRGYMSADKVGIMEFRRDNSKALADAYAQKNDFRNAYTYHNLYINYRDSMLSAEVKNKSTVLEHSYELEKKEGQIALLSQQKKLQKNFLASALIVLVLIIITAALLLRNNRQKQKANQLLQQQKQEIDDKAKELMAQKESLQQSYNNVETLGEIGHKISSSLSVEKIIGTVYENVNSLMDANVFGIGIYNESLRRIDFPATYENGQALPFYSNEIDDKNRFAPICFNTGKEIIINNLGEEYQQYLQHMPVPHEGEQPLSLIFLPLLIKEKKLGVITIQSFQHHAYSDYHLFMLRNIAVYAGIALDNAESYEELSETIRSLKSTQALLIQSEKMASLGELTAGIAHEIQNPLNFVTNFSEVNTELLSEMNEEIEKGNYQGVQAIAKDVIINQQKINHHGRRADTIVKGMLQHSRNGNSVKELTNINVLADEYLRLTYHGLKAKDKSFNAKFETEFDPGIGKVSIIRQDFGRVILNLITNAFYAVTEKQKMNGHGYEAAVSVITKKLNDKVLVSVKDNGNGIPGKVLEKIFQPFFTTKPTGQGTGLGLSISYDIIKAHGGEIKVHTKEGEGTEFTIVLPV